MCGQLARVAELPATHVATDDAAAARLQLAKSSQEPVLAEDLELLCAPSGHVKGRRELLADLVEDYVGLSGKCVPKVTGGDACDDEESECAVQSPALVRPMQANVKQLRSFLLSKCDARGRLMRERASPRAASPAPATPRTATRGD